MCSQNRPALTHLLSVTSERPWPIDDRICGFYAYADIRISAYPHTLRGFFYAVSCRYAHINSHKPQPHMRIEKQPHPYLYQHMKLYVTRPSSSPLKF